MFNSPVCFHFHETTLFISQSMASHFCHWNEKQALLIGVKRVIKSQGTCQNTQLVTWKSCQLVSSHNPIPEKVITILKQSREKLENDSKGMRNSHTGTYSWLLREQISCPFTSWDTLPDHQLHWSRQDWERPQHHHSQQGSPLSEHSHAAPCRECGSSFCHWDVCNDPIYV